MSENFWKTDKIRLRAIEPTDAEAFHEWNLDTEAARTLYWIPFPQSLEATRNWAQAESVRRGENDQFSMVIENSNGDMVGSIGVHHSDRRHGNFKYGVAVRKQYQRKGYASDAIRLVLRYYFEELSYHKAIAEVYSFNEPSIRLHEGLSFTLEGRLRDMIYTHGKYHDVLVYAILADEFGMVRR